MLEKIDTHIPGCYELKLRRIEDKRGCFVKTYHNVAFAELGLSTEWQEEYYSVSHEGVLRGLHFQLPPHDHEKLVYCVQGEVFDVVVDLRTDSPAYGKHHCFKLSSEKSNMVYIPKGCAHGFYTVSDQATMMYKVSSIYTPAADTGILWNSCGISWSNNFPVMSERDKSFLPFKQFTSPFRMVL